MIQGIVDWLENIILTIGYPGVATAMALESFFAPIPSEALMPFVGYMSYTGDLNLIATILVTTVASYVGTLPFYIVGYLGEASFDKFIRKFGKYLFISEEGVDRVFAMFDKYGNKIVLLGRLIPTVRSLISFPAGVAKMKFGIFTLFSLLGSLIWSTIFIVAGYLLGDGWEKAIEWISGYEKIVMISIVIFIIGYIGYMVWKMVKGKKEVK
jgi:membrane protein DedA with SNARE-associated domain